MKKIVIFSPPVATPDADYSRYELAKDKATTLPERNAAIIHCYEGMLWLTIAGDAEDYFLRAGESIAYRKDCAVVVQALRDVARFQVCDET